MEYIAFMHNDTMTASTKEQWESFFKLIGEYKCFRGGSEMGNERTIIGSAGKSQIGSKVVGYMKFEVDDVNKLVELLKMHPTSINGGSIEIIELPKS